MTHKDAARYFFQAVKEILPIWWQVEYQRCFLQHDVFTIQEIIESFGVSYREFVPSKSSAAPKSASSWQGHEEARPECKPESKPQVTTGLMDKRYCPCGRRHHQPTRKEGEEGEKAIG
jgi:hypothetical protein